MRQLRCGAQWTGFDAATDHKPTFGYPRLLRATVIGQKNLGKTATYSRVPTSNSKNAAGKE